ncbi:LOW QUALITY PROTEIN: GOLGA6L4 isoform 1 [Pan troglodytes]|uniref:GOLGA6L4 isoform 1 n=1 Tax=Pan troglodytes TaxID=9598 RepID=A0A2J8ITI8_PANTR|nr:LOW QUALITY PROTEIN: GOLGA6L4 isoform 1 [Pan troglodytes]
MWPQPRLPPHPAMSEKTQQGKLAAAKKKLKAYWQRKSPGIPAGANRKKKINGSSPDTAISGGYHSPGDSATGIYGEGRASSATLEDLESQYQELAVALDSSSAIISQLTENINSLVRTSKEEKKHEIHRVQKLGRSLFKLKNQTAEPLAPEPPAGPSKVEQLQDETNHLRKELESVGRQLQAEVENNQMLSLLNRRQEERLREQEERLCEQEERLCEQEERLCEREKLPGQERLLEEVEKLLEQERRQEEQERLLERERLLDEVEELLEQERLRQEDERLWQQETLQELERLRELERMLELGWEALYEQRAESRSGFEELNNENKSTLQLEQQVKELKKSGGAEEPRGSQSAAAARPVSAPVPRAWVCGQAEWTPQEHPGLGGEAVGTGEAAGGAGEAACHSFRAAENREINITII